MRALDMPDGLPKWEGLDGQSRKMDDDGNIIEEPSKDLEWGDNLWFRFRDQCCNSTFNLSLEQNIRIH